MGENMYICLSGTVYGGSQNADNVLSSVCFKQISVFYPLRKLQKMPQQVANYFCHPKIAYAA